MTRVEVLTEWSRRTVDAGDLTQGDLRVLNELQAGEDRRLELRWLRDGRIDVRTTSWVGVVRLSGVALHIRPKYAGDELGVVRMLAYLGGYQPLRRAPGRRALPTDGTDLLDILCHLLADEAELVLRDGLLHDYSTMEESLTTLRGSLRYREQATRRFGQLDLLECRFDEFHADVIENQLLRTGLGVAARICRSPQVRRRLRRLEGSLADAASTGPTDSGFYRPRLVYGRRNERYRAAHELSLLLFDRLGADDLYGTGPVDSFAFLINMNDVFEDFITAMVDEAFTGSNWRVLSQRAESSVVRNRSTGKRYASIIPDIVLSDGWQRVPFDCKYKLYGRPDKKISPADIYQTFLYAFSLGEPNQGLPRAGIIYPAEATTTAPELEIRRVDGPAAAQVTGLAFNLLRMQQSLDDRVGWAETLDHVRNAMKPVLAGADRQTG